MTTDLTNTASFPRRLAAMVYDLFLVVAVWMLSTLLMVSLLNEGHALRGPVFQLFLYVEGGLFFSYFWRVRGQTLGMQVWKIRVVNDAGELLTLPECAVRYFFASLSLLFLGLGFVWILFDPERLAWHDRASGTRIIFLGKDAYATAGDD